MKERPILFGGPQVRAILEGRKTQTRRPVKPQPNMFAQPSWQQGGGHSGVGWYCGEEEYPDEGSCFWKSPFGQPGDRLWVRETHIVETSGDCGIDTPMPHDDGRPHRVCDDPWSGEWWEQPHYRATDPEPELHYDHLSDPGCLWRPSIHMPRWASRITPEVKRVWIERVQEIDEGGAIAEGVNGGCGECGMLHPCGCANQSPLFVDSFIYDWNAIYAKKGHGWYKNPWVWCCEFERLEASDE